MVGAAGFIVDAITLYLAIWIGLGPILGRPLSFATAVTFTYTLNRMFTFEDTGTGFWRQWVSFVSVNAVGGAINISVYFIAFSQISLVQEHPVIGVALGSIAGLIFNFLGSKQFVFNEAEDNQ